MYVSWPLCISHDSKASHWHRSLRCTCIVLWCEEGAQLEKEKKCLSRTGCTFSKFTEFSGLFRDRSSGIFLTYFICGYVLNLTCKGRNHRRCESRRGKAGRHSRLSLQESDSCKIMGTYWTEPSASPRHSPCSDRAQSRQQFIEKVLLKLQLSKWILSLYGEAVVTPG